jgi:hypothetical protein
MSQAIELGNNQRIASAAQLLLLQVPSDADHSADLLCEDLLRSPEDLAILATRLEVIFCPWSARDRLLG